MNKLWVRLTLAFGLVTLTGTIIAAVLANNQVSTDFRRFLLHNQMLERSDLSALADYYRQNSYSWNGVEQVMESMPGPGGRGAGGGMRRGGPTLILADAAGRIVYTRGGQDVPGQLNRLEQADALPITLNGQTIGYLGLVTGGQGELLTPAAETFLTQMNSALLQAGLIAGGIGVLLGLIIARGLTAPLRRLAAAARSISVGELSQQVPVKGSEEMADLAQAFNDMAAALQEAEILRRSMVADIAHELRTPLTVIQGNLQAILDEVYPLEKSEIAAIYDESLMLSRLVNDLRELAQAEAGRLSLSVRPTELPGIIQQAVGLFDGLAQEASVSLQVDLPPALPPVQADPDRVRQVIHNLLANALRHTPEGGQIIIKAALMADAPARENSSFILLSVRDSGSGIPPEHLPDVFNRFWRADKSRSRDHGGTGLGLAIAKQLVEAQGGQIGAESEGIPGQGSNFWFSLPVNPAS